MVRKALGKGLESLLSEDYISSKLVLMEMELDAIVPNSYQPRKDFKETSLNELAESIKREGILQPLLVRKVDNKYQIVAGERRWRAAGIAGLGKVPVLVVDVDDLKLQQVALIENLQRENLTPLEEAMAYKSLIEKYGFTQAELAKQIGKKRPTIANMLRLLQLPEQVKKKLENGSISVGHAMAILSVNNRDQQKFLSRKIVKSGLSVREAETVAGKLKKKQKKAINSVDKGIQAGIVAKLREKFKTKVEITKMGARGKISLEYYSDEDLNRIIKLMGIEVDHNWMEVLDE